MTILFACIPPIYVYNGLGDMCHFCDDRTISFFIKILFILFSKRGKGKEKEREKNITVWLPLPHPVLQTWPTTQARARALTSNQSAILRFVDNA